MALSKEEILEAISEMSVMDIVDLISAMEEKFGVSAAAPVAVAASAPTNEAEGSDEAETASGDLVLAEVGDKKVDVCLLYTSPSPRDLSTSRMPSSA